MSSLSELIDFTLDSEGWAGCGSITRQIPNHSYNNLRNVFHEVAANIRTAKWFSCVRVSVGVGAGVGVGGCMGIGQVPLY